MTINWKNVSFAVCASLLLACCSKKNCSTDPCANADIDTCGVVSTETAACDFIANAGDRAFFEFDSAVLTADAKETLKRQSCWLTANSCRKVLIEGHCDERGTREYNLGLGERRAEAVAAFLRENNVAADRIRVVSYGKDRPISVECGDKHEFWRVNRVSISVIE